MFLASVNNFKTAGLKSSRERKRIHYIRANENATFHNTKSGSFGHTQQVNRVYLIFLLLGLQLANLQLNTISPIKPKKHLLSHKKLSHKSDLLGSFKRFYYFFSRNEMAHSQCNKPACACLRLSSLGNNCLYTPLILERQIKTYGKGDIKCQ